MTAITLQFRNASTLARRDATARPSSWNADSRTVTAIVATDTPVRRVDARGDFDEVLRVAADAVDLATFQGAHVLNGHRQDGVENVIGSVERAWIEGGQLLAEVRFSSRPEVDGIVADIAAGIIRGVSVGYEVESWADGEANGRRLRTATKWRPRELSFVAVPADPNARTRGSENAVAAIITLGRQCGAPQPVIDGLLIRGASLDQARQTMLDHMMTRSGAHVRVGTDFNSPLEQQRSLEDALYAKFTGSKPSDRAHEFASRRTIDLMRDCVGMSVGSPAEIFRAAMMQTRAAPGLHATSDFALAMANTSNRRLGELFRAAESGASAIVATGTVSDFRPVTEVRTTSFPSLEPLGEAGEIKWGSLDEEGETLAIASFARAIGVTFQVVVNDDLGSIDRSIRDVAFAAAQLKAKLTVAALGAKLADNKTLFHADHKNLAAAGATIDEESLSEGRIAMNRQKPPGSTEPLGIIPTILLVPPELQVAAEKMVAAINPASSETVNVFAGKLSVAVEPRLSDAIGWYLFAAPGTYPTLRFLTLEGYAEPQFEASDEFTRLGTAYRVHWHVGAGATDFRGAWKNPGEAPGP